MCGEKEIQFWHPADVTKPLKKMGVFGEKFMKDKTNFHAVCFDPEGWCYTGGENGLIQVWGTDYCVVRAIKAHSDAVTCVAIAPGQQKLLSGSKDGKISVIQVKKDCTFVLESQFDFHNIPALSHLPKDYPIALDVHEGNVLCGLKNGTIVHKAQKGEPEVISQCHWTGEAWGLAVLGNDRVVTCCDDNRVIMYDTNEKKFCQETTISDKNMKADKKNVPNPPATSSNLPYNKMARSVAVSKKHNHLAIATGTGLIKIRALDDIQKKIRNLHDPKMHCEILAYSPCENYLAVGCKDLHLYVYKIDEEGNYTMHGGHHIHSSHIITLDWTLDSEHIRTYSGDHMRVHYDVKENKVNEHGSTESKEWTWANNSMISGDDRQNMQPSSEDKTHINSVCGSRNGQFVFTADDFGLVNVMRWPNPDIKDSLSFCGHSEHVAALRLSEDQQRLFSIGGEDKSLIQWKVTGLPKPE